MINILTQLFNYLFVIMFHKHVSISFSFLIQVLCPLLCLYVCICVSYCLVSWRAFQSFLRSLVISSLCCSALIHGLHLRKTFLGFICCLAYTSRVHAIKLAARSVRSDRNARNRTYGNLFITRKIKQLEKQLRPMIRTVS